MSGRIMNISPDRSVIVLRRTDDDDSDITKIIQLVSEAINSSNDFIPAEIVEDETEDEDGDDVISAKLISRVEHTSDDNKTGRVNKRVAAALIAADESFDEMTKLVGRLNNGGPSWESYDFRRVIVVAKRVTLFAKNVYELLGYPVLEIVRLLKSHQALINVRNPARNPPAWVAHCLDYRSDDIVQTEIIVLDLAQIKAAIDAATWLTADQRILLKVDIENHPIMQPPALYENCCICIHKVTPATHLKVDKIVRDGDVTAWVATMSYTGAASLASCTREPAWVFPFTNKAVAKRHFREIYTRLYPTENPDKLACNRDFIAIPFIDDYRASNSRFEMPKKLQEVLTYLGQHSCKPKTIEWGFRPYSFILEGHPIVTSARQEQIKSRHVRRDEESFISTYQLF